MQSVIRKVVLSVIVILATVQPSLSQPEMNWTRTYDDGTYFGRVISETDEGYLVGGYHKSGNQTSPLMMFDFEGNIRWVSSPAVGNRNVSAKYVVKLPDGGFIAAGDIVRRYSYTWVGKYDSEGNLTDEFEDEDWIQPVGLARSEVGDIVIAGIGGRMLTFDQNLLPLFENNLRDQPINGVYSLLNGINGSLVLIGRQDLNVVGCQVDPETGAISDVNYFCGISGGIKIHQLSNGGYLGLSSIYAMPEPDSLWFGVSLRDSVFQGLGGFYYFSMTSPVYIGDDIESPNLGGIYFAEGVGEYPYHTHFSKISVRGVREWIAEYQIPFPSIGIKTSDGGFLFCSSDEATGSMTLTKLGGNFQRPNDVAYLPAAFLSSFPNPFNSSTTITYDVARPGFVRLGVFDLNGREVGTIWQGAAEAGRFSTVWYAGGLVSGQYVIKLKAGEETVTRAIMLVK